MLPTLFEPGELAGGTAVIIDVLRASTTMTQALASGVARVLPCGSVDEARELAGSLPVGERLLGGERGGERIEGFDLGNSPRDYTRERVGGRTIVFTTTNGTRALLRSAEAAHICIGAFVNLHAVAEHVAGLSRPVHLVCAGTNGRLTAEDILMGGMLADQLVRWFDLAPASLDVPTEMAIDFARRHGESRAAILETLRRSLGGENLVRLGMDADIELAAEVDTHSLVPVWDGRHREIRG